MDNRPKQYQQGFVEFYKLRFKVTPDVLIPRPESELLVDHVLSSLRGVSATKQSFCVLDVGTGSGNIAISLCIHLPGVHIIATDISDKALKIAKQNAQTHGVDNQIEFLKSDLLSHYDGLETVTSFAYDTLVYHSIFPDIIVTNLPYIPSQRIPYLDSSVKDYEPHLALDGGEDGFDLYRQLFQQITIALPVCNRKLKMIIGEIDYTHGELAISEAQKYFPKARVEVKTDLAQKQRILLIRF